MSSYLQSGVSSSAWQLMLARLTSSSIFETQQVCLRNNMTVSCSGSYVFSSAYMGSTSSIDPPQPVSHTHTLKALRTHLFANMLSDLTGPIFHPLCRQVYVPGQATAQLHLECSGNALHHQALSTDPLQPSLSQPRLVQTMPMDVVCLSRSSTAMTLVATSDTVEPAAPQM